MHIGADSGGLLSHIKYKNIATVSLYPMVINETKTTVLNDNLLPVPKTYKTDIMYKIFVLNFKVSII